MTYKEWYSEHKKKQSAILTKLQNKTQKEIIEYFDFYNMKKNESDFCLLYSENKKCHNIKELNCYFCACPYFIYDDLGLEKSGEQTLYSKCSINSKQGSQYIYENSVHQDCSNCVIPHKISFVQKNIKN